MRISKALLIPACIALCLCVPRAWAAGWQSVSLLSVAASNYGGAIVTFQISGTYDNSGNCSVPTAYTIRDAASLNMELAVLTAAFISGRSVNVYVTGSCDSDGNPNVVGVSIH